MSLRVSAVRSLPVLHHSAVFLMPPTSKNLQGILLWACPSVCPSVRSLVTLFRAYYNFRTVHASFFLFFCFLFFFNFIHVFLMKNKITRTYILSGLCLFLELYIGPFANKKTKQKCNEILYAKYLKKLFQL